MFILLYLRSAAGLDSTLRAYSEGPAGQHSCSCTLRRTRSSPEKSYIHLPQLPEEKRTELCLANRTSRATHGVPDVTARPSSLRPSKNCTSSSGLRLRNDLVLQGMLSARRTVPSTVMVFQMEFYGGTVTKQRYRSLKHLKTQYHTELNLGELKVTQGPKEIWYLL